MLWHTSHGLQQNLSLSAVPWTVVEFASVVECTHERGKQYFMQSFLWSMKLLMCLSMARPTWHTWGRCWRTKGNLALESSPRGWYLVGIVKTSRKIHEQPWGLMTIVTTDLYTSSTQIAYIFSFIMLKCLWKIPQIPIHPCHTLYTRGRYGVLVRDM